MGSNDAVEMVCPNCEQNDFNIVIRQIERGNTYKIDGEITFEIREVGEVIGSDKDENGYYCENCDEYVEAEELVEEA